MQLFDDCRNYAEDLTNGLECPKCKGKFHLLNKSKDLPIYECSICHARIKVTTRNNQRVNTAFAIIIFTGVLSFTFSAILAGL